MEVWVCVVFLCECVIGEVRTVIRSENGSPLTFSFRTIIFGGGLASTAGAGACRGLRAGRDFTWRGGWKNRF